MALTPVTYDAWGNAQGGQQIEDPGGEWGDYVNTGGPEGGNWERQWRTAADVAAGPNAAYDFGRYSKDVGGLPTLGADAFSRNADTGQWSYNRNDPFLNTAMNTAEKGANYYGMAALLQGTQDYGAVTGESSTHKGVSDATYKQLAGFMGVDTGAADWKDQVNQRANDYVMVKGMTGLNPNDPRASTQTLYQKQASGEWAPQLNYGWSEREKGSWWDEGGKYIMVPLGVVGAGLLAGAAAGGAAGGGGGAAAGGGAGITGTGGASGMAAYGGGAGGMGYGGLGAGAGQLGAGYAGAGASTLGSYGSLGASYWGAGGLGGYSGLGSMQPGVWDTLGEKAKDQLVKKARNEVVKRALGGLSGGQGGAPGGAGGAGQGGSGGSGLSGLLGSPKLGAAQAQEQAWLRAQRGLGDEAKRKKLARDVRGELDED